MSLLLILALICFGMATLSAVLPPPNNRWWGALVSAGLFLWLLSIVTGPGARFIG